MRIDGVIFDMDGTLLDSMFVWDIVDRDFVKSKGITPKADYVEAFKYMPQADAAAYYQREYGVSGSVEDIMRDLDALMARYYFTTVARKPGALELVERLHAHGVKMCIATATDRCLAEEALRRNGLLGYFSRLFTSQEIGITKTHPDIYEAALNHLGTEKENTLVMEDALYAIRTAKKAGFHVVGVYDASEEANQAEIHRLVDLFVPSGLELLEQLETVEAGASKALYLRNNKKNAAHSVEPA